MKKRHKKHATHSKKRFRIAKSKSGRTYRINKATGKATQIKGPKVHRARHTKKKRSTTRHRRTSRGRFR